jgi:REP element-mobilizing transposase RayT
MPSPWKYHPHGSVLLITFSLEEGLLLLANPLCVAIVKSCLSRAQHLHPLTICHFIVNGNHLHLVVVVENPDDVKGFIGRFKTESAHMFNRLLGRQKRTVWCEGYDSPVVLTKARAMAAITYLYANPAKDDLEDSIDEFPGLSSWRMFHEKTHTVSWKSFRRTAVKCLTPDSHNLRGYEKEAKRILDGTKRTFPFTINPNAWMEAFGIENPDEQERLNQRLIEHVRLREERARVKRLRTKKPVMGRERLIRAKIDRFYQSKRSGKRMWCLADRKSIRLPFIERLKALICEAKRIYEKWFLGDFSEPYPLGLYSPSIPKLAEPLVW